MAEMAEPHYVPALRKGLALLELLAERGPLTLAQVERASGLNRTMSYRLLRVMGDLGYVEHDPVRHDYQLGFRLLGLGAAAERLNLAEAAWPLLGAARNGAPETLTLAILAGNQVVYLGMLDLAQGAQIARRFAGRHAPHATSVGKAILAFLPDETRGVKVASLEPLTPLTSRTIVNRDALQRELARTRERGYAIEDEENRRRHARHRRAGAGQPRPCRRGGGDHWPGRPDRSGGRRSHRGAALAGQPGDVAPTPAPV